MNAYAAAGVVATVVAALGGLVWISYRAGSKTAVVASSQADVASEQAVTQASQRMAQAVANGPVDRDDLIKRLEDGTA